MQMVEDWLADARAAANQPNSNAMTLATTDKNGQPSARIVLCKGFDAKTGTLDFYTNYTSRKSGELSANDKVAVVFHWDHQSRQIRIEGIAERVSAAVSDNYFGSRHRDSQIGAWASDQSQPIDSRSAMEDRYAANRQKFSSNDVVPRPPHWGGFRIWASACELWVEGAGRVHDRARFSRPLSTDGEHFSTGDWQGTRLQP